MIYLYLNSRSSPHRGWGLFGASWARKHRTVVQNRLLSLSGRLGATGPSRMTPERSKEAARAHLGATNVLQSGTRVCRRATMACESAARDHLETASAVKSAAQACSRAAKPRKSMARASITAWKNARSNFVAALRSEVQLAICVFCFCVRLVFYFHRRCCMCFLCLPFSFSFLFLCVSLVFVSVSLFLFAVVFTFACVFR